MTVITITKEKW